MGGMEAVMFSLAQRFSLIGIHTLVACDKPYLQPADFETLSCRAPKLLRSKVKRLILNQKNFQPDLTICDSWKSVRSVPNNSGPVIVLAHGQEYLKRTEKLSAVRHALSKANLVVCSSNMTKSLVDSFDCEVQSLVIYPTYMLTDSDYLRAPNSHTCERIEITSICRLETRKGLLNAAKALTELHSEGARFRWTIAGVGPQEEELKRYIQKSALINCTEFRGRIDETEKRALLQRSDLFLMPSYQVANSLEGFGISYVEAAGFGIPSIAGNVGGAPEAVLHDKTGWCVDGSNPRDIKQALNSALHNADQRQTFGASARERFNSDFEGNVVFNALLKALQSNIPARLTHKSQSEVSR